MQARTLVVVGDAIEAASPDAPRRDYHELTARLDADVLHAGELLPTGARSRSGIALARAAAKRAGGYENVYCDSEHIGLPLAFLLRNRPRPRLTMIAHYLTPPKKRIVIKALRLQRRINTLVLHSPAQIARARSLGFRPDQVALMPYQVDAQYWRAERAEPTTHVGSAGQEFRDYRTFLDAVRGIEEPVRVAAGSLWSTRKKNFSEVDVPHHVSVSRLPYSELRSMYAAAHFVVVPLHDVDFQAGIITILEAMAMAKAVIVSRTAGQTGVVTGPLIQDSQFVEIGERAWPEPTGIYVPPGDATSLRFAIEHLLAHPDEARRMGEAGRRHVEAELSLEHFVARMAPIIDPALVSPPLGATA
jgi:glycosyltransferase involved in cell wall biosynthesis